MSTIEESIKPIIAAQFECTAEAINLSDVLTDVHQFCDSLDIVELTMAVEDELGIEIDDETMWSVKTGQKIVDIVRAKGV